MLHFMNIILVILVIHNLDLTSCATLKVVKLNDGHNIPIVGFGTWAIVGPTAVAVFKEAINVGYRHIDTALMYQNEKEIGQAIKEVIAEGKVKREDLFVTTKIEGEYRTRTKVMEAIKISLSNLGLKYVDLLLIHWPAENNVGTWQGMEDVKELGLAKSIGISNFDEKSTDEILHMAKIKPSVNQVYSTPYEQKNKLIEHHKRHDIIVEAYSPLSQGKGIFEDKVLKEIAANHNKSVAQVAIKFQAQRGVVVIPKTAHKERMIENLNIFDFELTQEDMAKIAKLNKHPN